MALIRVLVWMIMCQKASGHAYVYWPASRNLKIAPHIAHCFNVPGPAVNFQSAHNAGGKAGPSDFAKGMCGSFQEFAPKATIAEDGIANWAEAAPVATYKSGETITFTIVNHAEHGGHYEFRLCDRKLDASIGSREDAARCFDAHFLGRMCVPKCGCDSDQCLRNPEHSSPDDPIYSHGPPLHMQAGGHQVAVALPAGLTCETCTIQWFWHTAWGEQFWNCIDVRIEGAGTPPTLPPTRPLTTAAPAPVPRTCADLCEASLARGSCSSFTEESTCNGHYFKMGTAAVPCSWTQCGDCLADGEVAMRCPNLETLCTSDCKQLCGRTDLAMDGKVCSDLGDDEGRCVRSFMSRAGKSMPCRWNDCTCYADGETLLECPSPDILCQVSLLTLA